MRAGIEFALHFDFGCQIMQRYRMEQIGNLLSSAWKHTSNGHVVHSSASFLN